MKKEQINIDDMMLESEIYELIEQLESVQEAIYSSVPNEMIFLHGTEPNVRTRWGAVYFHAGMAKASLRAFL